MIPRRGTIAGALCIATTTCAATLPGAALAADAQVSTPTLRVADRTLTVGTPARVRGTAPGADGRTVVLEHRGRGGAWTRLATSTVTGGRFAFTVAVPATGALRASILPPDAAGVAVAASAAATTNEQGVALSRAVRVAGKRLDVRAGRRVAVSGRLTPATAGIRVTLQVRRGGHWRVLDRERTAAGGRFRLEDRAGDPGSRRVRVVAAGGRGLSPARRGVGRLHVYRTTYASWYGPGLYGRPLGCGGSLQMGSLGVAHKTLPCGTKVTFRHGGRSVTVRVIDRGPYVGGREYDLTAATAQRLGFQGHGAILATR
jgi:hypothetical protein